MTAFVMNAWKRGHTDQRDEATFLADGNAEFHQGHPALELDASGKRPRHPLQALFDAGG